MACCFGHFVFWLGGERDSTDAAKGVLFCYDARAAVWQKVRSVGELPKARANAQVCGSRSRLPGGFREPGFTCFQH